MPAAINICCAPSCEMFSGDVAPAVLENLTDELDIGITDESDGDLVLVDP